MILRNDPSYVLTREESKKNPRLEARVMDKDVREKSALIGRLTREGPAGLPMVPTTVLLLLEHRPAASRGEAVSFLFYSVLAGKHQREHTRGPLWIARIF